MLQIVDRSGSRNLCNLGKMVSGEAKKQSQEEQTVSLPSIQLHQLGDITYAEYEVSCLQRQCKYLFSLELLHRHLK